MAPGELVGKTDHDIWPRDLAESYRADDAEVMRTRIRKRVEEQLVGPDGQERWIETIKTPIIDENGDVIGTTGIARDITEQRKVEAVVRESEEKFRSIFSQLRDGILIADAETRSFIEANESMCRMLGYSRGELLRLGMQDLHRPEDLPAVQRAFEQQRRGDLTLAAGIPMLRKDGSVFFADVNGAILHIAGRACLAGIFRDVTERRKAEEALFESEERLTFMISNSPTVIYTCRPSGDFGATFISANVVDQMGYEVREYISDPGFWSARIHPDDKQRVFAGLAGLFEKGSHAHEYRFRHGDGTWRWMYDDMKVIKDTAGNTVEILGSWTDITERKLAEQALALKNFVFDVSIAANSIADTNGVITQANQAFLKIWGYSGYDEVIGKKISDFLEHTDETAAIIKALDDNGKWEGTYTARKKDGTTFIAYGLATVLRDEQGILIGYQSSVLDITEHRKADEALRQSEELLRVIFNPNCPLEM